MTLCLATQLSISK